MHLTMLILCVSVVSLSAATKLPPPLPKVKPPTAAHIKKLKRQLAAGTIHASVVPGDHQFVNALTIGDVADDSVNAVTTDNTGNVIVAGLRTVESGAPHPFVLKRSPSGGIVWSNVFTGNFTGYAKSVAADGQGNVIVCGTFATGIGGGSMNIGSGSLTSSNGQYDAFVVKLSPAGDHLWSHAFGDGAANAPIATESANGAAIDSDGSVYVASVLDGPASAFGPSLFSIRKYDSGGVLVWASELPDGAANGVTINSQHMAVVVGTSNTASIVRIYRTDGSVFTAKSFGPFASMNSVAVDSSNNIYAVGKFNGTLDLGGIKLTNTSTHSPQTPFPFTVALDSACQYRWSQVLGQAVAVSDNVFVGSGPQVFSFTTGGIPRWTNSFTGSSIISAVAVRTNLFVGGQFINSTDFGGGPVASAGRQDGFLVELGTPPPTNTVPQPEMSIRIQDGAIIAVAMQAAGKQLDFWGTQRVDEGTSWPFHLATFGAVPMDQLVAIEVPKADGFGNLLSRMFVKAINSTPLTALRMAIDKSTVTDTGRTISAFGMTAHIYRITP